MGKRIWRVAALCACLAIGGEIGVRSLGFGQPPIVVADPEIEYFLKPNADYTRFGNRVSINRHAMRSADFGKADSFDHTVFLLGDSVVYGDHFLDQSETIATQMCQNRPKTLCAAIAASSWGPPNLLAYYERFGPFAGDIAILVQSSHDRFDVPTFRQAAIPYRLETPALAATDAFFAIWGRMKGVLQKSEQPQNQATGETIAKGALADLLALLKRDFSEVVLIHHATRSETLGAHSVTEASHFFQSIAATAGVTFLDGASLYRQVDAPAQLFEDHIHLSRSGAAFLAASFAKLAFKN